MIRAAVVEDETEHAEKLNEYIMRYGQEKHIEFSVEFFQNGMDFLSDYNHRVDLVFMDIEMPHMNGMECAEKLRKLDENVPLVFVTSSMQYAIKGYLVEALGYMVKPVAYFPFSVLMDKATSRIMQLNTKEILIKNRDFTKRIYSRDLYYVEIMDHYLIYHTTEGEFREVGKLKDVEERLTDFDFFRCSNSHLVNLRFVQGIEDDEVLVASEKIFISRRRKKEFLVALNSYLKRGGL